MKRSLLRLSFPFREPYTTSAGVVTERQLLLLRIESADGHVGYGEAAPFEPYDGIPLERAIATLTRRSRGMHVVPWIAPAHTRAGWTCRPPGLTDQIGVHEGGDVDPGARTKMMPKIEAGIDLQQEQASLWITLEVELGHTMQFEPCGDIST